MLTTCVLLTSWRRFPWNVPVVEIFLNDKNFPLPCCFSYIPSASHESGIMLNVFPFPPDSRRLQTKISFIKSLNMLSKSSCQLLSIPTWLANQSSLYLDQRSSGSNIACPLCFYVREQRRGLGEIILNWMWCPLWIHTSIFGDGYVSNVLIWRMRCFCY